MMIGLKLRDEFLGAHMPGTTIALRTSDNQGAAQKSADQILSITYPTADVQTALKAMHKKKRLPHHSYGGSWPRKAVADGGLKG